MCVPIAIGKWWQKFNYFVRLDVLFFLGLAQESPSWSAGQCRDKAKLSAKLRSIEKAGQGVKGRWFYCLVDGCYVVIGLLKTMYKSNIGLGVNANRFYF